MANSIDYYSLITTPLKIKCNGNVIGTATGFFYEYGGAQYLVSNWHVVSGRNNQTGQARHSDGGIPDELEVFLHSEKKLGHGKDGIGITIVDENGDIKWLMHPDGQDIDIAVVRLPTIPNGLKVYPANSPDNVDDMAVRVAADVFVLGYPRGISKQSPIPIWKKATIASEPNISVDRKSIFLIDTATREGMSGSPVLARTNGQYSTETGDAVIQPGTQTKFLGVYSGRYGATELEDLHLGKVWSEELLLELLKNPTQGSYEIRNS